MTSIFARCRMSTSTTSALVRIVAPLIALVLVAASPAPSAIGTVTLAKDKALSSPTTTFAPGDNIYASAEISNLPNKVTILWQLVAENVQGQPAHASVRALQASYDMAADGTASYHLSPPNAGWPLGTYEIVLSVIDGGDQREQKIIEFNVHS